MVNGIYAKYNFNIRSKYDTCNQTWVFIKLLFVELAESKKKKKEEGMWHSLETQDRMVTKIGSLHISTKPEDIRSDVYKPPVNSLWDHIEAPTHDYDPASGKPAYGTHYGLEAEERAIIENLEREEREKQYRGATDEDEYIDPWKVHNLKPRRINNYSAFESESRNTESRSRIVEERITSHHESKTESRVINDKPSGGNSDKLKSWKSLDQLKVFSGLAQEIMEQVSKDAEWSPPVIHTSWRFFDLEKEQKQMEQYDQEQELKRQVT